ncbi:MAG: uracil-DNA glycosylase [Sandaracinaceae bacterium]
MSAEFDAELAELAALAAAHLRWERELGVRGLPAWSAPEAEPVDVSVRAPTAPTPTESVEPTPLQGSPPTDGESVKPRLNVIEQQAAACTRCRLHEGRTKSVFARGNPDRALVAFVGEGPGYHEDQSGLPFVGKAGQLLDKMIGAMGLSPDEIYVCNVVKCRPPQNRTPQPDEAASCLPYLETQLALVKPQLIVALGRHAAENLGVAEPGRSWRGEWGAFAGVKVMPTYHPAYLLRNPEQKRAVWQDLQAVVKAMGRTLPGRS